MRLSTTRRAVAGIAAVTSFLGLALSGSGMYAAPARASACTPTGFFRDGINLTAVEINPVGVVTSTIDATGCNIGVYYGPGQTGQVSAATIFGANYFGVVNNGGTVNILNSNIHDIGESPLNGDQHGVGIYFAFAAANAGSITGNTLTNYQKGGIVVNGGSATIINNQMIGQGPVDYIAQNGIQIGYGATATVQSNTITGNSYTGAGQTASGGIIVVGGDCYGAPTVDNAQIAHNTVTGNDIGVWVSELDDTCGPVTTPTDVMVVNNTIANDAINNTTGNGSTGYQAGIADQGDGDSLIHNTISGCGYTPVISPPPFLFFIDDTSTNNVREHANVEIPGAACGAGTIARANRVTAVAAPVRPEAVR